MRTNRLAGVDLFRGVAAYAVIVQHSAISNPSDLATQFQRLFGFAVPFFLAISFYFLIKKNFGYEKVDFRRTLISRMKRIIVPYCIWSALYFIIKVPIFILQDPESAKEFISDPVGLILLGGVSTQLYFLPLIFVGTLAAIFSLNFKKILTPKISVLCFCLSLLLYQIIVSTGNGFQLYNATAFQSLSNYLGSFTILGKEIYGQIARVFLANLAWLMRCLPYIFISIFLVSVNSEKIFQKLKKVHFVLLLILYLILNLIILEYIPSVVYEVLVAYTLLFAAFSSSNFVPSNYCLKDLGNCSFGIFLFHLMALNIFRILIPVFPSLLSNTTVASVLFVSITTFFVSWKVVSTLNRKKWLSSMIFGN